MKINRKEHSFLSKIIDQWQKTEVVDEATAKKLNDSVGSYKTEFDSLSVYAFVAAISCGILAFGA